MRSKWLHSRIILDIKQFIAPLLDCKALDCQRLHISISAIGLILPTIRRQQHLEPDAIADGDTFSWQAGWMIISACDAAMATTEY